MAADVAHEFGNLLTIVLGSLEPLCRQPLDDRGRRQLARAERGAARLCALLGRHSSLPDPFSR